MTQELPVPKLLMGPSNLFCGQECCVSLHVRQEGFKWIYERLFILWKACLLSLPQFLFCKFPNFFLRFIKLLLSDVIWGLRKLTKNEKRIETRKILEINLLVFVSICLHFWSLKKPQRSENVNLTSKSK